MCWMQKSSDRLTGYWRRTRAESMTIAVKAGVRAEGFVLSMETVGALRVGGVKRHYIIFENAL